MLSVFIIAVGASTGTSPAVFLTCSSDLAELQRYCNVVDCDWLMRVCLDEHGQATCGFYPLDEYTEYFYRGDPCQLDRNGVAGGSDADVCTRDRCNMSARRCDHEPIGGCRQPTPTRTRTPPPPPTPAPVYTVIPACGLIGTQRCQDDVVDYYCFSSNDCPTPVAGEVRSCCGTGPYQFPTCQCRSAPCSLFTATGGCTEARPISPDTCGVYTIPGCHVCLTDEQCPIGWHCIEEPDSIGGVCRSEFPTPTPTPPACAGDCNGDGRVVVNELVLAVGIALGQGDISACTPADANGDRGIAVNEIVAAVGAAVNGCAG